MMPRPECPVYRRVTTGGDELASVLRRLRKLSWVCRRCARQEECDALRQVRTWVGIVSREVLDELRS